MKTNKLKTFLALLFCLFGLLAKSQTFMASYDYDANGNRVKVTIIYLTTKSAKVSIDSLHFRDTTGLPKTGWNKGTTDDTGNFTAVVYPNPVCNLLVLELSSIGNESISTNSISVWNMSGKQILFKDHPTTSNQIDFSRYPTGTYVLKVSINGTVKNYKIIKE